MRMRVATMALLFLAALGVGAAPTPCDDCVETQYWQIDPDFWKADAPDLQSFPERQLATPLGGSDLGIAFSGGGTRSATSTIGELRGLEHNHWLEQVRYVTAVSGGSWAAVPFTYYAGAALDDLLGRYQPPGTLIAAALRDTPNGRLALQVVHSGLAASGIEEVPPMLPDAAAGHNIARWRQIAITARDAARKLRGKNLPESTRRDKTYAHMLGQIFIDPLVPDGNRRPYSWTRDSALGVTAVSGQGQMDFTQVSRPRPFLIVGGTAVWTQPAFVYPRLIPVEYTPLYTGIRQRYGNLGGTYVMPWVYDRERVAAVDGHLRVDRAGVRMFTLADMIGSSGAAPQLSLILGRGIPAKLQGAVQQAAGTFPAFSTITVRDGRVVSPAGVIAHGDGGFTDNLGLMPLLARQVHHIIAFVNSNKPYTANDQLQSYFFALAKQDGNGDKTMNAVFPAAAYRELLDGLDRVTADGGPAVFCQTLNVTRNELYNIASYSGAKVCWVYNFAAGAWKTGLSAEMQGWLKPPKEGGLKALQHFPYYATFEENKPSLIKLSTLQVNLLADLAAWSVTNPVTVERITTSFGESIVRPNRP